MRPGIPKSSEALGFRKILMHVFLPFPSSLFPCLLTPSLCCIWFHVYPVLGSMPVFPFPKLPAASAQVEFPGLCWRVRWKPIEVSDAWSWDCVRGTGQTLAGVESTELEAARGAGLSLAVRLPICLGLGQACREMARCCPRGPGSPWSGQ